MANREHLENMKDDKTSTKSLHRNASLINSVFSKSQPYIGNCLENSSLGGYSPTLGLCNEHFICVDELCCNYFVNTTPLK